MICSRSSRTPVPAFPDVSDGVLRRDPDDLLDLLAGHLRDRAREVDLVDAGDDRQVAVDREVGVRERLRLDPLRRVDDEDRPLARRQRPGDLVGEVDVAGRVDQVQDPGLPVLALVVERDGAGLDRDAALLLDRVVVEDLLAHLAGGQRAGDLQDPVGKGRLPMVDVGDDREVADAGGIGHGSRAACVRTLDSRRLSGKVLAHPGPGGSGGRRTAPPGEPSRSGAAPPGAPTGGSPAASGSGRWPRAPRAAPPPGGAGGRRRRPSRRCLR